MNNWLFIPTILNMKKISSLKSSIHHKLTKSIQHPHYAQVQNEDIIPRWPTQLTFTRVTNCTTINATKGPKVAPPSQSQLKATILQVTNTSRSWRTFVRNCLYRGPGPTILRPQHLVYAALSIFDQTPPYRRYIRCFEGTSKVARCQTCLQRFMTA